MRLAGQGDRALHRSSERGYAMAALLVGLSVMAIMMSVALPVWTHFVQREKEAELIWRGEQYKRAIMLFQRKYANTFPPTLDILVEQKFLRKKYKDPVTGEDFQIVPVGGQARPGGMSGGLGGGSGLPSGGGQTQQGQQFAQGLSKAAQQQSQVGQQQANLGIQGVTSKSTETSIKLYNGRDKYNEWMFVHIAVQQRPGGGVGGVGSATPGMVGPGGQPLPGGGGRGGPGFGAGGAGFGTGGTTFTPAGPGGRGGFQPGMPGGFQPGPGGLQPAPGGTPGPFQTPPGTSPFQPVNPGGPKPTFPPVPSGFGQPPKPPGK